jgi:chemotaxis protein CheD
MTDNLRAVPIGEIVASRALDDVLVAYGVGSCVAICLYDPVAQVGGMLHALLPSAPDKDRNTGKPAKFVDRGTQQLVKELQELGAKPRRLIAQLCGGAQVLNTPGFNGALNIGERNILAAQMALEAAGLRVQAQDTGGHIGRTVRFYIADGRVTLRSLGRRERLLGESGE